MIVLDDDDRVQLREALATALGGHAPAAHHAASVPSGERSVPVAPGVPLLHAHLAAMDKIIATHEEVMQAALGAGKTD